MPPYTADELAELQRELDAARAWHEEVREECAQALDEIARLENELHFVTLKLEEEATEHE